MDTDAVEEKGEIVVFHGLALREGTVAGEDGVEELELEKTTDVLIEGKTRGLITGDTMTEDGLDPVELLDVVSAVKGRVVEVEGVVVEVVDMEMSGQLHDVPRARLRSQRSSSRTLRINVHIVERLD
jgi:hypothetical protein